MLSSCRALLAQLEPMVRESPTTEVLNSSNDVLVMVERELQMLRETSGETIGNLMLN